MYIISVYTVYTHSCTESYTMCGKCLQLVYSSVHQNIYEVHSCLVFNSIESLQTVFVTLYLLRLCLVVRQLFAPNVSSIKCCHQSSPLIHFGVDILADTLWPTVILTPGVALLSASACALKSRPTLHTMTLQSDRFSTTARI